MKSLPRHIVGISVMLIAVGIIGLLFFVPLPDGNREVALVVLGVAIGWASSVVTFHYGSSEGSKEKSELLAHRPDGTPDDPVHVEEEI